MSLKASIQIYLFIISILFSGGVYALEMGGKTFGRGLTISAGMPSYMGRLLSLRMESQNSLGSYQSVIPHVHSHQDFVDLFAAFYVDRIPLQQQTELLVGHPSYSSYHGKEAVVALYAQKFREEFNSNYMADVSSELFQNLRSPSAQQMCSVGNCWVDAATSVFESVLAKKERPDISETFFYLVSAVEKAKRSAMEGAVLNDGDSWILSKEKDTSRRSFGSPSLIIIEMEKHLKERSKNWYFIIVPTFNLHLINQM
jgi:hypothetical protein